MGRKKNGTIQTKEKFQHSRTANSSVTARNINKSDLSGVIFGCKNYTIQECHIKQLFGLPAPHFSYVRNISPGMPLFLFNYSDRKLYGTYEAASIGQMNIDPHGWTDGSESTPYPAQLKSPDLQSFIAKLVQEMEGLKASHLQQFQRVNSLEKELVASKKKIKWLEDRCEMMESGAIVDVENTEPELMNSNHTESILVVGGFDGSSYLSSLHSYSPFKDEMKPLCSMSIVHSYASAVKLNGELYILGGGDGNNVWYSSVQSYDGLSDQWISRPSLNQKKGNLAGTCVYNKIFSIGGANALECFSDVEVLDLEVGKWICTQPMLQKRSAPAATEINGMIYAVGGYCGNYLKSVERLDPREKSWTALESMNLRRGCHSLVALNEKLYAIGGYDGSTMVRTVEVFDPRIGSWVMGESMIASRGYSAAVVIGTTIYVIGGADNVGFVNTVECYKEGGVWEVTNLKAFGQRCFFSAIAL